MKAHPHYYKYSSKNIKKLGIQPGTIFSYDVDSIAKRR
jgi:hypothetical protein